MNPDTGTIRMDAAGPVAAADLAAGTPLFPLEGRETDTPTPHSLQIGERRFLEPRSPLWRAIPHGCDADCAIDFRTWTLVCRRPIAAGTPLRFDRRTALHDLPDAPCRCGTERCDGSLRSFARLPEEQQERIAPACSPFVLLQRFLHSRSDRRTLAVLTPHLEGPLGLYGESYDDPAFKEEVHRWGDALGLRPLWIPVSMAGRTRVVERLEQVGDPERWICLNLCDGSELDGYPGLGVVEALDRLALPYTGAGPDFFAATNDKIGMKTKFVQHGVPTSPWVVLSELPFPRGRIAAEVGFPAIVKPSVSAGSHGISIRSVVHSDEDAARALATLVDDPTWGEVYRAGGVFAERFVQGREFTVFLVGDRVFPPVERVFHSGLPPLERLLSYDRYWATYESESPLPPEEPFYRYSLVEPSLSNELEAVSLRAFRALDGTGYARVDLRRCDRTGALAVLEVNANCGLSERETSVGEMANRSGIPFLEIVTTILDAARTRAPRRAGDPARGRD